MKRSKALFLKLFIANFVFFTVFYVMLHFYNTNRGMINER